MSIIRKVKAVERVFKSLDNEVNLLKEKTGLGCIAGCGKCCTKPDIHASPLEFLPLAFNWFRHGMASHMLERLKTEPSTICFNYSPLSLSSQAQGGCNTYIYRGLICRLFGYAASSDKNGELKLVTCKSIKEELTPAYNEAVALIKQKQYIPVFSDYYRKLYQIDFKLANQIHPINEAMRKALEEVLHYYAYRPFGGNKKAG